MKVFVTGINGFLGSHLASRLAAAGHEVAGSVRDPARVTALPIAADALHTWQLESNFPTDALTDRDLLIHCAFSKGRDQEQTNIRGTRTALEAGESAGVAGQLFLSSFSARPDAASGYGKMKHALEQDFLASGYGVLRPGLVLGPGGLFAGMIDTVRRLPFIPVPDGGHRTVPIVGRDHLADCVLRVLEREQDRPLNLCYSEQPKLRDLLRAIARALGKRRLLVPFPTGLVLAPVQMLNSIGLRFGVDAESLRAYRTNTADLHLTDYPAFDLPEPGLDEAVREAMDRTAE